MLKKIKDFFTFLGCFKRLFVFRDEDHIPFSYRGFFVSYIGQSALYMTALLIALWLWLTPVFDVQAGSRWYLYPLWFIGAIVFHSAFEWFYHRYLLHKVILRGFASQHDEHEHHHSLTKLAAHVDDYIIKTGKQTESATFPWYALPIFGSVFGILYIVPLQLLFPNSPVLVSCFPGVTFSLMLYEMYHAAMHEDYQKHWCKTVEKYPIVRRMYAFHRVHHVNKLLNQAIGGLCGWPVWDIILGTRYVPDDIPMEGPLDNYKLDPPDPCRLVQIADDLARKLQKRAFKSMRLKN